MKALVTKIWYDTEDNHPVVNIKCRLADGNCQILRNDSVRPYFFACEPVKHMLICDSQFNAAVDLFGRSLHKYYTRIPSDVPKARDIFGQTWQADIPFADVARVELGIKSYLEVSGNTFVPAEYDGTIKPRIAVIDIETEDFGGLPNAKNPIHKILSCCIYDSKLDRTSVFALKSRADNDLPKTEEHLKELLGALYIPGKIKVIECETEVGIFEKIDKYIKTYQPDIITGWNVESFDCDYISARSEKVGYKVSFKYVAIMDLMERYERVHENELESKALDFCAQQELGVKKLKYAQESVEKLWEEDFPKFCAYNIADVLLVKGINDKVEIIPFFISLAATAGGELENYTSSRLVDMMLLHMLRGVAALPTKGTFVGRERYEGAYIHPPSKGIFENVFVADLKSEYPSIILTFNLSPETIITKEHGAGEKLIDTQCGFKVRTDKIGVIPQLLMNIMGKRDELRAEMDKVEYKSYRWKVLNNQQRTLKEIYNSIYGIMAYAGFRLYTPSISAAVAAIGQRLVKWVCKFVEDRGATVLYADTDSCFFRDGKELKIDIDGGNRMIDEVNASFSGFAGQYGLEKHYFHIKLEKRYQRWFQGGAKKRYAGYVTWADGKTVSPYLDVKGMEIRRSSSPKYTRKWLKHILEVALSTGDVQAVNSEVEKQKEIWRARKLEHFDIGIPCGISMALEEYKTKPIHITAAKYSNAHLGKRFSAGDKPMYFFVRHPTTHVIALDRNDDWPVGYQLDWDQHYRRCFEMPTNPLLEGMGILVEEGVVNNTVSLDKWF